MEYEQILQLLILAAVVLVYWWSYRSFPPQQTAELLQRLSETSSRTETRIDDLLVEVARLLNEMRPVESEQSDD